MGFCSKCSKEAKENDIFCSGCGNKLEKSIKKPIKPVKEQEKKESPSTAITINKFKWEMPWVWVSIFIMIFIIPFLINSNLPDINIVFSGCSSTSNIFQYADCEMRLEHAVDVLKTIGIVLFCAVVIFLLYKNAYKKKSG